MFQSLRCLLLLLAVGCRLAQSQPLFEDLWTIESSDGVLNVFLVDELSNVTVAGQTLELRVWNQSFTGPLLKCKRGDQVKIYLLNKLDQDTNLHFHGFHVSPKIPADDSVFMIGNNNKIKLYEFTIPDTHPQGLFWYHSHAMPNSEYQIFNGMSGAFVVEGLLDPFPGLASELVEKTILLRDIQIINGSVPSQADFVGEADTIRLVNGEIFPNLTCPVNETQLWNIANIGADISYELAWEHPDGSIATEMEVLLMAKDGILRSMLTPITDKYILGPANRAQFLVKCPTVEPALEIRVVSRNFTNGLDNFPFTELFRVDVTGVASNNNVNLNLTMPSHYDYRQSNITGERTIVFSQASEEEGGAGGEEEEEGSFFINNRPFSKSRVDVRTFLGSIERWKIINISPEVHYFHIHQGHFQVVAIDGVPQPFDGYVDTVLVDHPATPDGNVTVEIIIPFTDKYQVGKYSFHCHIEAHADGGMMATLEVIEAAHLDIPFIAVSIPVLFITFILSNAILGYQWYSDRQVVEATESSTADSTTVVKGNRNSTSLVAADETA